MAPVHTSKKRTPHSTQHRETRAQRKHGPFMETSDDNDLDVEKTATEETTKLPASQQPTQNSSAEDKQLSKLLKNMLEAKSKRKATNLSRIQKAYTQEVSKTKEAMEKLFDLHEKKASEAHEAQVTYLRALLARKTELENEMHQRVARLRRAYDAHAHDVLLAIERRIQELN